MKRFKSVAFLTVILTLIFAMSSLSFAGSFSRTYSGSFASDWTNSAQTTINGATLVLSYGYNTFLINEDCASSLYYGSYHNSRIKNANGTFNGPLIQAHEWSDLEIRHSGTSVTYYSIYEN